jgi:hypothetical protein
VALVRTDVSEESIASIIRENRLQRNTVMALVSRPLNEGMNNKNRDFESSMEWIMDMHRYRVFDDLGNCDCLF